jgi:hypothetical protein
VVSAATPTAVFKVELLRVTELTTTVPVKAALAGKTVIIPNPRAEMATIAIFLSFRFLDISVLSYLVISRTFLAMALRYEIEGKS